MHRSFVQTLEIDNWLLLPRINWLWQKFCRTCALVEKINAELRFFRSLMADTQGSLEPTLGRGMRERRMRKLSSDSDEAESKLSVALRNDWWIFYSTKPKKMLFHLDYAHKDWPEHLRSDRAKSALERGTTVELIYSGRKLSAVFKGHANRKYAAAQKDRMTRQMVSGAEPNFVVKSSLKENPKSKSGKRTLPTSVQTTPNKQEKHRATVHDQHPVFLLGESSDVNTQVRLRYFLILYIHDCKNSFLTVYDFKQAILQSMLG